MSRSSKIKRYEWRVNGMMKCLDYWGELMQEPERDGAFHKWDHCEQQGEGLTETMEEMIYLASEVDPQSVELWVATRRKMIDMRIKNYQIMASIHDGFDRPVPTPEEEAAAEAEKRLAFETGGASPLSKKDEAS